MAEAKEKSDQTLKKINKLKQQMTQVSKPTPVTLSL